MFSDPQASPDGVSDEMEGLTVSSKYKRVWVKRFLPASSLWCHCWIKAWWWLRLSSGPLIRRLSRWACPSCWATATWRRRRRRPTTTLPVRHCVCSSFTKLLKWTQISGCLEGEGCLEWLIFEFSFKKRELMFWTSGGREFWRFCRGLAALVDLCGLLFFQASHRNRRAPSPRRTWTSWSNLGLVGGFTNTSFPQNHSHKLTVLYSCSCQTCIYLSL